MVVVVLLLLLLLFGLLDSKLQCRGFHSVYETSCLKDICGYF